MENDSKTNVKPFLKWAGGKRWFVSQYSSIFPCSYNRYIEPFLGSGAVYFNLCPEKAILSDINKELIDTYKAIKKDWKRVFIILKHHHRNHNKEYYYKTRASKPRTLFSRAARLIYHNRTCWNGLYRVNMKGEFNVPIGTKKDVVLESDNFAEVSRLLHRAQIKNQSFEFIINQAMEGDLLFADPPYTLKHSDNGFIKYNEELFDWEDQEKLRECLIHAKKRGVQIVHTNADFGPIKKLYKDHFKIIPVKRNSIIAADPFNRGRFKELIISSI